MTLLDIAAFALVAIAGWLVWDSLRAREAANAAMRAACRTEGLLFLDDTVGLTSIVPARNGEGRVRLKRVYGFEYSDTGQNRRKGSITMIGSDVLALHIGLRAVPDDVTIH